MSSADLCRANGWGPGTRISGDEGYGPTVIEITAIGYEGILARCISHKGKPRPCRERSWMLQYRDWKEVGGDIEAWETKTHWNPSYKADEATRGVPARSRCTSR